MDEKKSFFAGLEPKSAMLVGGITGFLALCTIGFFILLIIFLKGGLPKAVETASGAPVANPTVNQPSDNQPAAQAPVVPKKSRPTVELFVMSYCPFGLQMEKAYLPAWNLLKNKADISVKFVSYAMHGLKEVEENTRQYCIEKEQADKYRPYLGCFTGKDDYKSCLQSANVNEAKMNSCISQTNKTFGTIDKYNDQSTWLSGQFPLYPVYDDLNQKYGVQGSPTLVINGAEAQAARTPEAVKEAICAGFDNPPEECQTKLSDTPASAGFGTAAGTNAGNAACGG